MNTNITPKTKHYTPSFQAYYKSSFGKRLEKALKNTNTSDGLQEEFNKILAKKKNSDNKIGEGSYGSVYRIDDYYVFKIYHKTGAQTGNFKASYENKFQDLKVYCGKVLAKIGNVEIIRNVTKNRKDFLQMANPSVDGIEAYNHSLKEFISLPQKAFDKLAKDFMTLNSIHNSNLYYSFDTNNPNNFIKVGKSIKIVDDIDWTPCKQPNDIYNLMHIFIKKDGDINLKKEIFKKCALACEKQKLPMDAVYDYLYQFMDDILQNAGIKMSFDSYYHSMQDFRNEYPNDTKRMLLVKNFIESL